VEEREKDRSEKDLSESPLLHVCVEERVG